MLVAGFVAFTVRVMDIGLPVSIFDAPTVNERDCGAGIIVHIERWIDYLG